MRAPYLEGDYGYEWTPEELVEIGVGLGAVGEAGHRSSSTRIRTTSCSGCWSKRRPATRSRRAADADHRAARARPDDASRPTARCRRPYARGYLAGDGPLLDVTEVSPSHYWATGNLVSTASDVGRRSTGAARWRGRLRDRSGHEGHVAGAPGLGRGLGFAHGEESCGDCTATTAASPATTRRPQHGQRPPGRAADNSISIEDTRQPGGADRGRRSARLGRVPVGGGSSVQGPPLMCRGRIGSRVRTTESNPPEKQGEQPWKPHPPPP